MSTLSSYENYTTENGSEYTAEEKAKFVATGVLPVSGKYHTDDAKPKTKSVKLSDLIGGGSDLPEHGSQDKDKVLTVVGSNGDEIGWRTVSGGGGSSIIVLNAVLDGSSISVTYNNSAILPSQVIQMFLQNPNMIIRCENGGSIYIYHVSNYFNGEQQYIYFDNWDYGSGGNEGANHVICGNACDPNEEGWFFDRSY